MFTATKYGVRYLVRYPRCVDNLSDSVSASGSRCGCFLPECGEFFRAGVALFDNVPAFYLVLLVREDDEVQVGVAIEVVLQSVDCEVASKLLVVGEDAGDKDVDLLEDVAVRWNSLRSDRVERNGVVWHFDDYPETICLIGAWCQLCSYASYVFQ